MTERPEYEAFGRELTNRGWLLCGFEWVPPIEHQPDQVTADVDAALVELHAARVKPVDSHCIRKVNTVQNSSHVNRKKR